MLIKIHVTVDSKKETVEKIAEDKYRISVREPAEEGRANERVVEIVRSIFPSRRVRIVSGHHAPAKIISLEDKS